MPRLFRLKGLIMREVFNENNYMRFITLTIPTQSGEEYKLAAIVSGVRLLVLVDEYPLQNWLRENAADVLQSVVNTTSYKVRELKIYADCHK